MFRMFSGANGVIGNVFNDCEWNCNFTPTRNLQSIKFAIEANFEIDELCVIATKSIISKLSLKLFGRKI